MHKERIIMYKTDKSRLFMYIHARMCVPTVPQHHPPRTRVYHNVKHL
nr:MAG TPA: hypothetical protein [Caudoviricetes sp.]